MRLFLPPLLFPQVRSQGTRIHCGFFIAQYLQHENSAEQAPRLGVIASRRVGNAVKRNYGKRLIRNLFRKYRANFPNGIDLVIVLRSNFDSVSYKELETGFCEIYQKISAL